MNIGPMLRTWMPRLAVIAALAVPAMLLAGDDDVPQPKELKTDDLDALQLAPPPQGAESPSLPKRDEARPVAPPAGDKPADVGKQDAEKDTGGAEKGKEPAGPAQDPPVIQEIPKPSGDALVLHAHGLTASAKSVAEYTQILGYCQQGVRLGLSPETDQYARRLMSWAFNRRGELLAEQGHDSVALADFEAAVHNDKTRWRAFHNRGVSYAMMGRHKQAITDFNRTLELNPTYANAYFNRGEVRYETGEYEEAVRDYTRAIQLESDDPMFYNSRGHAYYRVGKFREAAHDYTVALRLNPQYAAALTNRGDLYTDLGFYDRAVADYQKAVRSDPSFTRAYLSAAWLMATCPDVQYRSIEGAMEAISKAEHPESRNDYRYLDTLAAAHANAGNYAEAQRVLRRAIELAPKETAQPLAGRLSLYRQEKAYRIAPRDVPQVAERPKDERAQPSNYEQPVAPRSNPPQRPTPAPPKKRP